MPCPDVAVIIVSYNTRDLLRECIRSVVDKTHGVGYDVVVVDNCSSDGSAEMVEREFPEVTLITNSDNRGFAAANNQAIRATDSRHVALLNSDAMLLNDTFSIMADYLDRNPDVGVVGPRTIDGRGEPLATAHTFENLKRMFFMAVPIDHILPWRLKRLFARLVGREATTYLANFQTEAATEVDWVSAGCMMVRRDAIAEAGLLDEAYFMYMEDEDWCRGMKQCGWKVVFLPFAEVRHLVSRSPMIPEKRMRRMYASRRIYHQKHNPRGLPLVKCWLAVQHAVDTARARYRHRRTRPVNDGRDDSGVDVA